ncbi:MAG: hypothetical protein COT59_01830, partial [Candidatus Nealsonbacteria bacterium CG09_land_8_20_14_0_10_42_14]
MIAITTNNSIRVNPLFFENIFEQHILKNEKFSFFCLINNFLFRLKMNINWQPSAEPQRGARREIPLQIPIGGVYLKISEQISLTGSAGGPATISLR